MWSIIILYACMHAKLLQLCLTLCNPLDCSPPGSSVHGILQARVLEWGAIDLSFLEFNKMESCRMPVTLFAFLFFATCRSLSSPKLGTGRDAGFGFSVHIPSGLPGGLAYSCHEEPQVPSLEAGSSPGSGRSPGGGHGNPSQCSCLENPMDRGAWWATVQRVAKSQT